MKAALLTALGGALMAGIILVAARPVAAIAPATSAIGIQVPRDATGKSCPYGPSGLPECKIGQELTVRAVFTTSGSPGSSRLLLLTINGGPVHTASVSGGVADFKIRAAEVSPAGVATIVVSYPGSRLVTASRSMLYLRLLPVTLRVDTVPVTDGIPITFGGTTAVTRAGSVRFSVDRLGSYPMRACVDPKGKPLLCRPSDGTPGSNTRISFVRWSDEVFSGERVVEVRGDMTLQLGLSVSYRSSFEFHDGSGNIVPPDQIQALTVTGTAGIQCTSDPAVTTPCRYATYDNWWLESATAIKRAGFLEAVPRSWRVLDVRMAGSNVVTGGAQIFAPAPTGKPLKISLLLFDLGVQAQDALFGSAVGGKLDIVFPDGTVRTAALGGSSSQVLFPRLPRGDYTLNLHAGGIVPPTPVTLSRSQVAVVRVITYLDLAVGATLMLIVVAVLLWLGRRQQILAVANSLRARRAARRGLAPGAATAAAFDAPRREPRWRQLASARALFRAVRRNRPAKPGGSPAADAAPRVSEPVPATLAAAGRAARPSAGVGAAAPAPQTDAAAWTLEQEQAAVAPLTGHPAAATPPAAPPAAAQPAANTATRTGRRVADAAARAAARDAKRSGQAVCRRCHHAVPARARYCGVCGEPMPQAKPIA
ncbi:MAG: hypothetical protein DLM71_07410 [Chloroflexi bacterium]|nr:MAG: hypothetical protein DLM71_07410 [Chloroflexota bacterium]